MTIVDGVKISELPTLPGSFNGTEFLPVSRSGTTYKDTIGNLSSWLIVHNGINRPPTSVDKTNAGDDTTAQFTGNLFVGTSDLDSDPITLSALSYNGTAENLNNGSFQTTYGIFFVNALTGDYTFTTGVAARALTTGQTAVEIFTYSFSDGRGGISTSTLTITITGTNSIPVVSSVANQTPINQTVTGNLLYRQSFDYEPTPLTILHYRIEGITGTWAAGSTHTISGEGAITIQANGDYTFVPASDYFGPVATIVYTVTDGGNNVDAYLRLAVTPLIPGSQPIVICTDIESGPISGGESNNGALMSILGYRFGSPSDMGGTTKVYIGGHEVAHYWTLENARASVRHTGLQHMRVQVGALGGALTLGEPYPITVVTAGGTSNASCNFTPNPGRVLFVSKTGNDLTAVPDDITKPFRMLQYPNRGDGGVYPILRAGDQVVIRGGTWSDLGFDTAWFRFRDPTQQGSNPTGAAGTGWISFTGYPNEDVHYVTPGGGAKGCFQGPGSAFNGTCGDWVSYSNMHLEVGGGSASDAAPVNMQYNAERTRVVNMEMGPWVAGDSPHLNAACVTGQGNRILIACNDIHDIEGTSEQQNHGTYGGTSAYGWTIMFNSVRNCVGGSHFQFNDSDGGTGNLNTPFGIWTGFTNIKVHHNWCEDSAKYGLTFSDVGAYSGELDFRAWNNVFVRTGLAALRLNTTTLTSDGLYAYNTCFDCNTVNNPGTGNAVMRNEGVQTAPNHSIKAYNNIFAFGPHTVANNGWQVDPNGQSSGYHFARNLYWANGQTPSNLADSLAIYGDPLFTASGSTPPDLSLQSGSPAANAGTQALPADLIVEDDFTALAVRSFGGAPDIGAFEIGQTTPYVLTAPSFSGGPQVGVATTVTVGTWGNSPTSYSRQFTANGVPSGSAISGTGTASKTWAAGDSGKIGRCEVTATNGTGFTTYPLTIGTIAVGVGAPVNTVPPAITGTAQAGNTLTLSNGTWTGTVDSYSYAWYQDAYPGTATGTTTSTYALGGPDVGHTLIGVVTANNSTTGGVTAATVATATILPAAADPTFVQVKTSTLRTDSTAQAVVLDSNVSGNNLLLTFYGAWDQHTYNISISDTQGHTTGASSWATAGDLQVQSNNPFINVAWLKSNATGAYTQSINTNVSQGGVAVIVEVTGIDQTTIMDLPSYNSTGSSITPAISGAIANTKPNDLVYVVVGVAGASGATCTTPSGWTLRATISGGFQTMFVFELKETTVETFGFSATLDSSRNWGCISVVVKGS